MSTHPQRMQRAIAVAAAYRKANQGHCDGGYVMLWRQKATGWSLELDRPQMVRPGVLAVSERGAVWIATGGSYGAGAQEFSSVWDPAPAASIGAIEVFEGVLTRDVKGQFSTWAKGTAVIIQSGMVAGGYNIQRKSPVGKTTLQNCMASCPMDAIAFLSGNPNQK